MIEENIMNLLKNDCPFDDLLFTINYAAVNDNIITVYSTPGDKPSTYEGVIRDDEFQVDIKSSDFDKARALAYYVFDKLHNLFNVTTIVQLGNNSFPVRIYLIEAKHEPALLGTDEDEVMKYTLNFVARIDKI